METKKEIVDRLYDKYDEKEYCTELIYEAMDIFLQQSIASFISSKQDVIKSVCDSCNGTGRCMDIDGEEGACLTCGGCQQTVL